MAIPEKYADILDKKVFAQWATIGPTGEPQVNPVWFDFDGEHILISQTKTRQKFRNVKRDPRVAISFLDPDNPYRYLEVRGEVVDITDDEGNAFINKMAQKYLGQPEYQWHQPGDERIVVRIQPKHASAMG
ncbi:MAG: uncharacterized protein QOK47_1659 [Actinomycetota bacterium]|jgi:PPOX class probable F420-dependent enzyme|nr:uncharacterized protein [Actinomycetota bacterium]